MRRMEKEITNRQEIEHILSTAMVCRVAFSDQNQPYIVPMNFGYKDDTLYFHCAKEGRKLDILRRNNKVCFEVDCGHQIINTGIPCEWSTKYTSVIGFGTACIVEDDVEKKTALDLIIDHYSPGTVYEYSAKAVRDVGIIKIDVDSMTGKKST